MGIFSCHRSQKRKRKWACVDGIQNIAKTSTSVLSQFSGGLKMPLQNFSRSVPFHHFGFHPRSKAATELLDASNTKVREAYDELDDSSEYFDGNEHDPDMVTGPQPESYAAQNRLKDFLS